MPQTSDDSLLAAWLLVLQQINIFLYNEESLIYLEAWLRVVGLLLQ